jgi:ABC-type branched-subunit amino acid transport system ATPase component/ABC-type branched-subunit amino acid transport system permease subunit
VLTVLGVDLSAGIAVSGLLLGLTYGVLAVGLVLIFRASRVVNLAHVEVGAFGAALMARMVVDGGVPWFVALPVALAIGAAIGAVVELVVVRRLASSPPVVLLVATLGVAQLLLVAQIALPDVAEQGRPFPLPFDRTVVLGTVVLDAAGFLALGLIPAAVVVLALFLDRTPTGLAVRAAADNRDAAELAGISIRRVSTLVWALAGGLAVLTVVLANGLLRTRVGDVDVGFGPGLLLRALAAALIGRFVSLPLALAGGVAIGIADALLQVNLPGRTGYLDAGLFVLVLLLVLYRALRDGRQAVGADATSLAVLTPDRPLPAGLRGTWWAPRIGLLGWTVAGLAALTVPALGLDAGDLAAATRVPLFAILGLSLVILTGWAGQLSLGQIAFYGLGAFTAAALVQRGVPFPAAVAEATVVGVLAALVIGLPALLVRGLFLAITTLAFAVAAFGAVFQADFLVGESKVATLEPGTLLGLDLRDGLTYYYLCLGALLLCALLVAGLRRSGIGRSIIAVRSNADRASALTLSPTVAKLTAFGLSGGLAAFAGALFAGLQRSISYTQFPVFDSLTVVALVMIGGVGSVAGAVLGAVYVLGIPALFGGGDIATLLTSSLGLLVLLLYLPGGLRSLLLLGRDAALAGLAGRRPVDQEPVAARAPATLAGREPRAAVPGPALEARHVTVRFGGRTALDDVDLVVQQGEVLGLIGANGAGKSTLLGAVSGFVPAQDGTVRLLGRDVTGCAPHERARSGLGRVFQDARLFDDLTVRESVLVALEARERAELIPSLLRLPPARSGERRKQALATDHLDLLGLGPYADAQVRTLSTGTRRIVELCCLLAQDARVLLLDEPTAGLAQREAEVFGPLLLRVRRDLDATLVIVEHDIPLVMAMSDRVQCLSAGTTLAVGAPEEVRSDPAVIASYLGTDERAIARSGAVPSVS